MQRMSHLLFPLRVVACDPGVRTFITAYDSRGYVHLMGSGMNRKLYHLGRKMDKLISRLTRARNEQQQPQQRRRQPSRATIRGGRRAGRPRRGTRILVQRIERLRRRMLNLVNVRVHVVVVVVVVVDGEEKEREKHNYTWPLFRVSFLRLME